MTQAAAFIAEPQNFSPRFGATTTDTESHSSTAISPRQHHASIGRRLSGRLNPSISKGSLNSKTSLGSLTGNEKPENGGRGSSHRHHHHRRRSDDVIAQITEWLQHEKSRRAARIAEPQNSQSRLTSAVDATRSLLSRGHGEGHNHQKANHRHARSSSARSDTSLALEDLENILEKGLHIDEDENTTPRDETKGFYFSRRGSTQRRLLRKTSNVVSSDTDYQDGDVLVPSAEVVLDNSKTLGYSGGVAESQTDLLASNKRSIREKEAWLHFKKEIVRLAHTLRLKGWRKVPIEQGGEIDVERLSGALTNAVYVVSPPSLLPQTSQEPQDSSTLIAWKRPPQ